jgi:hypothetical protein
VRPYGAADTPGNSGAALSDLYGFGDTSPTGAEPAPTAQLSDDDADAARSQPTRVNDGPVIDAFEGYYDMWPTGTSRGPGPQPAATPAAQRYDDLDAALAAYEEGASDTWLRRVLGLPEAVAATTSCFTVELQPTPSSQAADPESEAYAAAKEAFDSGAVDPMLRDVLGSSGFGRHVLLVHTNDGCSARTASGASAGTAGDWRSETDTSSGYSPGVAADGLASLYGGGLEPVA